MYISDRTNGPKAFCCFVPNGSFSEKKTNTAYTQQQKLSLSFLLHQAILTNNLSTIIIFMQSI
jgi:hypothetical protein